MSLSNESERIGMPFQAPAARPVDVLITSTHEWTSRSLASILAPRGYVVRKAYNGAQTLARVRGNPPDAIILDEQLPDCDAYTLCRQLNEENLITPSTPVFIALPRQPTRRDRLVALRANAWACLGDPLDAEELIAMLGTFVPGKLDADEARSHGLVDDETGVYNLHGVQRRAEELAAQAARKHSSLCCILLMPEIEPAPGAEDAPPPPLWLLRRVATALRTATRHSDAIGRLHSNSFAVVATDTNGSQARQLAERLAAAILAEPTEPSVPPVPRLRLRAGCHAVTDIQPHEGVKNLMEHADTALRRARADSERDWLQGCSA
jgi:PleD family two-component response regulator